MGSLTCIDYLQYRLSVDLLSISEVGVFLKN
jgi:hypothetical protein